MELMSPSRVQARQKSSKVISQFYMIWNIHGHGYNKTMHGKENVNRLSEFNSNIRDKYPRVSSWGSLLCMRCDKSWWESSSLAWLYSLEIRIERLHLTILTLNCHGSICRFLLNEVTLWMAISKGLPYMWKELRKMLWNKPSLPTYNSVSIHFFSISTSEVLWPNGRDGLQVWFSIQAGNDLSKAPNPQLLPG